MPINPVIINPSLAKANTKRYNIHLILVHCHKAHSNRKELASPTESVSHLPWPQLDQNGSWRVGTSVTNWHWLTEGVDRYENKPYNLGNNPNPVAAFRRKNLIRFSTWMNKR
jgi:hypothetical protein